MREDDFDDWLPLWDGYNRFYGRFGDTALPREITQLTWSRFFDGYEPVHARVAERDGRLVGLVHFLYHRSTTLAARPAICRISSRSTANAARAWAAH